MSTEELPLPKPTIVERAISARIRLPVIGTGNKTDQILTERSRRAAEQNGSAGGESMAAITEDDTATGMSEDAAATKLQALARGSSSRRVSADTAAPAEDGGFFGAVSGFFSSK